MLTDQIFADPSSTAIGVFADNGTVKLSQLKAWQLQSIWK